MKNKIWQLALPVLLVVLLLFIWQIAAVFNLINTALFSSPLDIIKSMFKNDALFNHILHSLYRLGISVCIGYLAGFLIGLVISFYKQFRFLEDIVSFFMSIPGISWAPVFIILIGFGDITIISVGILTAFFPVVYNIFHGIRESDKNINLLGDLFEYNFIQKLIKINIPAIMNYLVIALKLAFARTWRTIIAVEMIAATTMGLGYMIFDARELINTKLMFSGILISGLIFIIIETGIRVLEKITVVRWGMKIES